MIAGHPRLKSSTTVNARNLRPSLRLSWMKSGDHRCIGRLGTSNGMNRLKLRLSFLRRLGSCRSS